ncbi:MAG: hypothetical protein FD145_1341 [Candidatus Saganbacteria bacterium]|uniref:Uncharacterized protein n=1 Tax=Candidatus Saganbacteria bacterium TaxID=2575572 RepID=A0A833L032_UNCSA|nr:MAG: hypothetical protein FD145_1341 [Candidatus Saganbacteria bacterium]
MAIIPNPAVNFGSYGNTGTIDVSKFSRTGSPYTDPNSFALMLAQNMNDFDILFGDEEKKDSSTFGSSSLFSSSPSSVSPYFGGLTGVDIPSDIGGQNTFFTGVSPAYEMIARSNLIGKTVEAVNPSTGQKFSGKVESVSVDGGILLINVGGTLLPPENLVSVTS